LYQIWDVHIERRLTAAKPGNGSAHGTWVSFSAHPVEPSVWNLTACSEDTCNTHTYWHSDIIKQIKVWFEVYVKYGFCWTKMKKKLICLTTFRNTK
jgi:hypothetical protein